MVSGSGDLNLPERLTLNHRIIFINTGDPFDNQNVTAGTEIRFRSVLISPRAEHIAGLVDQLNIGCLVSLWREDMKTGCLKATAFVICTLITISVSIVVAAEKNKEKNPPLVSKATGVEAHVGVDIFIGKDRDVIQRYFVDHAGSLPPGLAKRGGNLPPGLAKQLRRKGHLPPGLEKKVALFPVELERRLTPLQPGLVRGFIEGRAVIYNKNTSVILDIFAVL